MTLQEVLAQTDQLLDSSGQDARWGDVDRHVVLLDRVYQEARDVLTEEEKKALVSARARLALKRHLQERKQSENDGLLAAGAIVLGVGLAVAAFLLDCGEG